MSDPVVQQIKDKLDIAEVLGEYIQLRRAGTNFKARCPFHNEKTPSLMVNRERGVWRCFGCNEGGDVFSFIQKHEGLTFPEVLKILADKAGVQLPERRNTQELDATTKLREELLDINELTARFYHEALLRSKSGEVARNYLATRGVKDASIKKWVLGFAPDDFHQLEKFLATRGISKEKAIQAGVLVKGERAQVYDRFRFRVMFPLFDYHGRIVGFTGRTLSQDDKQAKYVNSPETPIYHKSAILYGLNFAKLAIKKADAAVIAEGNMDCLSSHEAGIENVVASSGTALTTEQLRLVGRLTKNLIFAFDTDTAGAAATRRGLETALAEGFSIKIARLTSKDPDELIKENVELWRNALSEAPNFLDFSFDAIFSKIKIDDREALRKGATQYSQIIALLDDPVAQAQEAKRLKELLDVPLDAVLEYVKRARKPKVGFSTGPQNLKLKPRGRSELTEEKILGLSLANPDFQKILKDNLSVSDFSHIAPLADLVFKGEVAGEQFAGLHFLGEEEMNRFREQESDKEKIEKEFIKLCRELKILSLQNEMNRLGKIISAKEKDKSVDLETTKNQFNELARQKSNLTKEPIS